ncbi:MAG: cytochrome C oxidase subunit IV family protein [Bacteroidetes bacterium]|nr:cytochrome C oxidase subunit IV family protein [Bacteroidota bacterium]
MHKKLFITYILLILLTITGALLAGMSVTKAVVAGITVVSVIKFITVAFQFMELKHAHNFWRVLILLYVGLMATVFIVLL